MMIRDDPRMAACVDRYHTWPHIRPQSVGEHSFQIQRILLAIWPECPREVLVHAIVHDLGEVGTGDAPYPVKAENPVLKREMDRIEDQTVLRMCLPWGVPAPKPLPEAQQQIFKLAEFIEMYEWAAQELMMGNQFARLVADRCFGAIRERLENIRGIGGYDDLAEEASRYVTKRAKEWSIQ
jgi:5'-deoxynucleotidase YfbR-like HD superfamily hydrolase